MASFQTIRLAILHSNPQPGDVFTDNKGRKIIISGQKKEGGNAPKKTKTARKSNN